MPKIKYSCGDIDIDHASLLKLWKTKDLNLGIREEVAIKISETPQLKPKKTAAAGAFHFWNWIAIGIFAYSVYASFTINWWWFIPCFTIKRFIWKVNKKSNSQNLLNAAFIDQEFL